MSNSSKGAYNLAVVIQNRMNSIAGRNTNINAEVGTIVHGKKLKLYSLPDNVFYPDDYSICSSINVSSGDRVLVVWTFDGEPVVIDKIVRADMS